jgi:hypothetical protein
MNYIPQLNHYVKWSKGVEGWVYFICDQYITIEQAVRPKSPENYQACSIHRNERVLILCYREQWKELEYIKSRQSVYEDDEREEKCMEMVGESIGREGIEV